MNLHEFKERLKGLEGRRMEDELYRIVWEEIQSGQMDPAAQARSITDGEGDDAKIRAAYIKHRVRRLEDEIAVLVKIERELEAGRQREETEKNREIKETENRRVWAKNLKYFKITLSIGIIATLGFYAIRMHEARKVELERILEQAINRCDEGARKIYNNEPTENSVVSVDISVAELDYWNIPLRNRRHLRCSYSVVSDSATFN